jgi:molybdate transport system permease protein
MTRGDALEMTLLTLRVAGLATLAISPLAIFVGYAFARWRFRGRVLLQAIVALPMVVPPVAVGLGLLLLLRTTNAFGLQIVFTWWAAVLAAAVVGLPLLVRSCEQSFAEIDPRYEDVSRSLGLGPIKTFFRVSLPLARRGVLYGTLLCFTRAMGEFGATALVAGILPGRTETLALGVWSRVQLGDDRAALMLCGISFGIALATMLIAEGTLRGGRASSGRASHGRSGGRA